MHLKDQLPAAKAIIARTGAISMPKEVMALQDLFQKHELPSFTQIEDIISQNALLAGEVVQTANFPSMQGKHYREIHTISDAIDVLGARRLRNLVKAISLKLMLESFGLKSLSDHSMHVATLASKMAAYLKLMPSDEAYLLGLFHNVGAMMLAKYDPQYKIIFNKSLTAPISSLNMEYKRYHTSHGVVGLLVAEDWGLEDIFKKVIVMHNEKNLNVIRRKPLKKMIAMIQLANALVAEKKFQVYMTPELEAVAGACVEALALEVDDVSAIWAMI